MHEAHGHVNVLLQLYLKTTFQMGSKANVNTLFGRIDPCCVILSLTFSVYLIFDLGMYF